jgi:hypothetical protein
MHNRDPEQDLYVPPNLALSMTSRSGAGSKFGVERKKALYNLIKFKEKDGEHLTNIEH